MTVAGTTWHSPHATGVARFEDPSRCDWCAPTVTPVVADAPCVSTGGALSLSAGGVTAALPWHPLHACDTTSTVPLHAPNDLGVSRVATHPIANGQN